MLKQVQKPKTLRLVKAKVEKVEVPDDMASVHMSLKIKKNYALIIKYHNIPYIYIPFIWNYQERG